jgi:hypothetical protein
MAPVREVAFELECFEWVEERLEVAGRWKGLGPHRLNRPVLTVETDTGRRKRIVAMPGGHLGAAGETWRASFAWPGDPAEITGAELEVGGNLVVDLPLPDRRRRRRRRAAAEQHTDEVLRADVAALRGQVDRLRAELAGREREIIALRAQLDEETDEEAEPARAGADERTVEIQRLAGELERLHDEKAAGAEAMTVEIQRLVGEVERLQEERAAGASSAGSATPPSSAAAAAAAAATIDAAVLDAPGPLRAGSRPSTPPGRDGSDVPADGGITPHEGVSSAFQALKARFEGLFASNGHTHEEDEDEQAAVPRPRRSAAAARARAEATVAARRSPGEVWGMRVLAAVVVAVLLTAFVLILAYIA